MATADGQKTGGRKKGTPNKTTALAKEAIESAFEHLQTKSNAQHRRDFKSWAEDNPSDFYKLLLPKLLPVQLNHGDANGERLVINIVRQGADAPDA